MVISLKSFIAILLLGLGFCHADDEVRVSDPQKLFSISCPDGWDTRPRDEMFSKAFPAKHVSSVELNTEDKSVIVVMAWSKAFVKQLSPKAGVAELAEFIVSAVEQGVGDLVLRESRPSKIGEVDARQFHYMAYYGKDRLAEKRFTVAETENRFIVSYATYKVQNALSREAEVAHINSSFKLSKSADR